MKTIITQRVAIIFIFILIWIDCFAQSVAPILPPGIAWKRSDRLSIYPFDLNFPYTYPNGQIIDEASEDWWYAHKNSYKDGVIAPENFDGFITCGYSQVANVEYEEYNGGCSKGSNGSTLYTCEEELDFSNFPNPPGYYHRTSYQTIGKYDAHGKLEWFKSYNGAWFSNIIQTSDGNYVATGPTSSTRQPYNLYDEIWYNPEGNGDNTFGLNNIDCLGSMGEDYERKINVVKISPEGEIIWNYIYGVNDISMQDCAKDWYIPWDLVEYDVSNSSKIRIVGEAILFSSSNTTKGFMLDINTDNGTMNWIEELEPHYDSRKCYSIEKQTVSGDEYFAVISTEEVITTSTPLILGMTYFDAASTTPIWDVQYPSLSSTTNPRTFASDLCFNSDGDILVPIIFNCNFCYYDGVDTWGEAAVCKFSSSNGSVYLTGGGTPIKYPISDGTAPSDLVHAYDLKIGITNTFDDGFAIVTSKVGESWASAHNSNTEIYWPCNPDISPDPGGTAKLTYWNADAFVRKFAHDGTVEWSKTWDIDDQEPEPYPGDKKKQECLYSITETPDYGLVVAGNNSRNFDDCYLVKLYDNCNNLQTLNIAPEDGLIYLSVLGTNWLSWNVKLRGSLIIQNGQTLTIYGATVEFADTRKCGIPTNIIVEPGGTLIITNGSRLTSIDACEPYSMWDGIQLWGDNLNDQSNGAPGGNQPVVIIDDGSVIENARYGIIADKLDYSTHEHWLTSNEWMSTDFGLGESQAFGGGYINASGADFKNCRFSVVMDAYPDQEDESIIELCNFILDAPIHDFDALDDTGSPLGINCFIKLYDVHRDDGGLIINSNDFHVDLGVNENDEEKGTAVSSFDSNFQLTQNNFYGLHYGLIAGASDPLYTFIAKCNTMEYMDRGMSVIGINSFLMHNNSVTFGAYGHPIGAYIDNSTGYFLEQNDFNIGYADYDNSIGLIEYFQTQNPNINNINNNVFNGIRYGMLLEGDHVDQGDPLLGLKVWCNEFYGYEFAIAVTDAGGVTDPGIAGDQIGPHNTIGANNMFDSYSCIPLNEGEIFNPSPNNPIDYYHKLDNGGYFVEPASGCYTPPSQVNPSAISSNFNKSLDCGVLSYDCDPVYRLINNNLSTVYNSVARLNHDTITPIAETGDEFNELMRYYLHSPGIVNRMDSVINLIQASAIPVPEYLLKCAVKKNSSQDSLLISQVNSSDDSSYAALSSIMELTDSADWKNITGNIDIKNALYTIAMDSSIYGYTAARNILRFTFGEKFPEIIILPDPGYQFRERKQVLSDIKIYPNPFTGELFIELDNYNEPYDLTLYNILGEEVKKLKIYEHLNRINLSELIAGLYVIHVSKNGLSIYNGKISCLNK